MLLLHTSSFVKQIFNNSLSKNIIRRYASSLDNHFDIVIAGGGMVGTTLACTLGKNKKFANKSILLLEASKQFEWSLKEHYSNRVVALNPSTKNLFDEIDVWKYIADARFAPVKKLQIWDALSDAMITFSNDDLSEIVAYIVENDVLLAAVNKEIMTLGNVSIINEAKIKEYQLINHVNHETKVILENGDTYTCDLLLGCDGANSKVRKAMGVQYICWDYNQMGIVATLKLAEEPENVVAWQRCLPTGPIAILPLKENLSSLVWTNTTEQAKLLLQLPPDQFVDAINDAIWKVYKSDGIINDATKALDNFLKSLNCPSNAVRQLPPSVNGIEGSRAAFPLGFGHSTNYVAKGVALVGDAAHRIHPLAGQGVNLGFGDVIELNKILGNAVYSGNKLGVINDLKEYETNRQRHNLPTMLAVDGFNKLYRTEFTPLVLLRSLGLQFTHALSPLKKALIGQASS